MSYRVDIDQFVHHAKRKREGESAPILPLLLDAQGTTHQAELKINMVRGRKDVRYEVVLALRVPDGGAMEYVSRSTHPDDLSETTSQMLQDLETKLLTDIKCSTCESEGPGYLDKLCDVCFHVKFQRNPHNPPLLQFGLASNRWIRHRELIFTIPFGDEVRKAVLMQRADDYVIHVPLLDKWSKPFKCGKKLVETQVWLNAEFRAFLADRDEEAPGGSLMGTCETCGDEGIIYSECCGKKWCVTCFLPACKMCGHR